MLLFDVLSSVWCVRRECFGTSFDFCVCLHSTTSPPVVRPRTAFRMPTSTKSVYKGSSCLLNKHVASMIGMVLHGHRAINGNLIQAHKTLEIARDLGKQVTNWNAPSVVPCENVQHCMDEIEKFVKQGPRRLKCAGLLKRVVVAADASDYAGGYVYITPEGRLVDERSFDLPKSMSIFLKEVIAARMAIADATQRYPKSEIVLLEDNTAAAIAIARGWSTSKAATEEIIKIHKALQSTECTIVVKTVPGKINPADEPSRKTTLDWSKAKLFQHLYHTTSYVFTVAATKAFDGDTPIRHMEDDEVATVVTDPLSSLTAAFGSLSVDEEDALHLL